MADEGFVRVVKNFSYFKRFQVKFRRRREGKTIYSKRKKFISQDKTKFNAPKYRFVSNKYVICQVIWSKLVGDEVICQSHSSELPRYGYKLGLNNYPAVYCTAFLCGRRLLKKLKLDEKFESVEEISGDQYLVDPDEEVEGSKPFTCYLDIGLSRSTVGAKVFGALKGACDAGLYIPHKTKKFPGNDKDTKEYDPEKHKERIFGEHIANHMRTLKEEDFDKYKKTFSQYIKLEVSPDDFQSIVENTIENIKKNPQRAVKEEKKYKFNKHMVNRKKKLHKKVKEQKVEFRKQKMLKRRERLEHKKAGGD